MMRSTGTPAAVATRTLSRTSRITSATTSPYVASAYMVFDRPRVCISTRAAPLAGDDRGERLIVTQAADVVDDRGAVAQRGAGDLRLVRVHGKRDPDSAGQRAKDRLDARDLFGGTHLGCARPRRLSSHVDEIGALGFQSKRGVDGGLGRQRRDRVGEGIGRDVEDPHHRGDARPGGAHDCPGRNGLDGTRGKMRAAQLGIKNAILIKFANCNFPIPAAAACSGRAPWAAAPCGAGAHRLPRRRPRAPRRAAARRAAGPRPAA